METSGAGRRESRGEMPHVRLASERHGSMCVVKVQVSADGVNWAETNRFEFSVAWPGKSAQGQKGKN